MSFELTYILIVSVVLVLLVIRLLLDFVRHRLTMKALIETNDMISMDSSLDYKIKETLDRVIYYFNESNEISNLESLLTPEAMQTLEQKVDKSSDVKPQPRIIDAEDKQKRITSSGYQYLLYFDSYNKDDDILTGRIFFNYRYCKHVFTATVPAITLKNNYFETICLSEGIRFQCKTNPTIMFHRIEKIERDILLKLKGSASILNKFRK